MPKKKGKKETSHKNVKIAELRREVNYGKSTLARVEKEWKQLCLDITVPKMREEVLNCWHYFEKIIDNKDYVISLHMDELRNQEDMYRINLQSHQENMEKLMLDLSNTLTEIHEENNNTLMNLIQTSLDDWQNQMFVAENSENHIKTMNYGLESLSKRWDDRNRMENFAIKNELISKHNAEQHEVTSRLEKKLANLWKGIRSNEENYWQRIRINGKRNIMLKEADRVASSNIEKELKKLMKLHDLSKRLTTKLNELIGNLGKKLEYLENERDNLSELQISLRSKLYHEKVADEMMLTLMVVEFVSAFEDLNTKLQRGEDMIKLVGGIHKYEISREKILPYPHHFYGRNHVNKFSPPELMLFWKRVASADEIRYNLNEERTFLKMENKKLLQKIHTFCQCLDCPGEPLVPKRAGRIPYTEGREMLKKIMVQNGNKKADDDYV